MVQTHDEPLDGALARAHAPDQRHPLAGGDLETDALDGRIGAARIREAHIAKLDVAAQLRAVDEGLVVGPLDGLRHDFVERFERRSCALVLHQQADDLPGGGERTGRKHVGRDQRAHRELALGDQINANHDHRHRHQLHQRAGGIHRPRRQPAHLHAGAGQKHVDALPLRLDHAFGALRLDGFDGRQAFDQRGVALRAGAVGGLGQLMQAALKQVAQRDDDGEGHHHRQRQPRRNPRQHADEDQPEGQVDQGRHGARGDEVAHLLEAAQVLRERAHRLGPMLEPQAQHLFHQPGRQHHVDTRAGLVHEVAAQQAHEQIGPNHQQHADGQRPQRFDSMVGYDAVVDVHREHRQREGKQVDQQRGQQHVAVDEALRQQRAPEPVLGNAAGLRRRRRAAIEAEMRPHEQHQTAVARFEFGCAEHHSALASFGHQHACAVALTAQQHAGLIVAQDQQHGQGGRIDVGQRQPLQPRDHAGACGRPFSQIERQTALAGGADGQARRQRGARGRMALQTADLDQAVE